MEHIIYMTVLGFIGGMISGFWTRIIKPKMIFGSFGKWLKRQDDIHMIQTTKHDPIVFLIRCIFCFSVWCCFLLDAFYIIEFSPCWIYALIGVFASLGAGNFVSEIICALRPEE